MTALSKYDRLEASGLWRASPDAQRRDVVAAIGDASLTIYDQRDQPLAHWSLAALQRANPGQVPAIFHPDGDPGETLELPADETRFVAAIDTLTAAIERARPHPGRVRLVVLAGSLITALALAAFWLPGALRKHVVSVLPEPTRVAIGQALFDRMQSITGPPCTDGEGLDALIRLSNRLATDAPPPRLVVVRSGVKDALPLLGNTVLINRALVEDHDAPEVLAGYILAQQTRAQLHDPLEVLLRDAGPWTSFRLLTTGALPASALRSQSERLLQEPLQPLRSAPLLAAFERAAVRAAPYAYAVDISGETTLPLIEGDPFRTKTPPALLSDADWVRLQGICGG